VAGFTENLALFEVPVNQLQNTTEPHTQTAAQSVAVEMQARYHHPGWVRALQAEGYAGTLQVLKAVQHTWGWQSVAEGVVRPDQWQTYYEVLVQDRHQLGVPEWLRTHPQAYAQTIERLIQAQRHGHWTPDAATQRALAKLYQDLTASAPLAQELTVVREWVEQQTGGVTTSALNERLPPSEAVPLDQRPQPAPVQPAAEPVSAGMAPEAVAVRGQLLERRDASPASPHGFPWALMLMGGILLGGGIRQWCRGQARMSNGA
jgi:cobaltochelatase CobN